MAGPGDNVRNSLNVLVQPHMAKPGMRAPDGKHILHGVFPSTTANAEAMRFANQGHHVIVAGNYKSDKQVWYWPGGGKWQPGGGSGGTGAGVPGQVAANASQKQFTGNATQQIGATNIQNAGVAVLGEFLGANFRAVDTKVPEGMSPDCMNVDGMGKSGAMGPRPGLIAMYPKRNDQSNLSTTYTGRSINLLSPGLQQSLHMTALVGFDKSSQIGTSLSSTLYCRVKRLKPLWHPQRPIEHIKPKIKLTGSAASTGLTLNISAPPKYRKNAPQVASVDELIVRVSTSTYPRDRDGKDDTDSRVVHSNDTAYSFDYYAYNGTSTNITARSSLNSTGATNYFSVWFMSKAGESQRASIKVEVQ